MNHSTGKPTKAQDARFKAIQALGCLACRISEGCWTACEIHHLLSGNKRRGHDATIGLCGWHHRGVSPTNESLPLGPSLAQGSKSFHERYGSDDALLEYQNKLLGITTKPLLSKLLPRRFT